MANAPIPMEGVVEGNVQGYNVLKRNVEVGKIYALASYIKARAGFVNAHPFVCNIDDSNTVAGSLLTVFNYMRKLANCRAKGGAGLAELTTKYTQYLIKSGDLQLGCPEFTTAFLAANEDFVGFDFMIATPIVNMLTAFKLVFNEGRLGTNKFASGAADKNRNTTISRYGLTGFHGPQLFGLTFNPERRTGLLECMGPATLAINLMNGGQYKGKVASAFSASIKHLEIAPQLTQFFSTTQIDQTGQVLALLCDCLNIIGSREHQKMYPPLFAWMEFYRTSTDDVRFLFDFSGKGAYYLYNTIRTYNYQKNAQAASVVATTEAIFHGIWGTYGQDLGVLGRITNHQGWLQRHEMERAYKKTGAEAIAIRGLPSFLYNAKLIQSNMGKFGSGTIPWLSSRPVFAGYRKRVWSAAFEEVMTTGETQSIVQPNTISLQMYLIKLKDGLMRNRGKYEDIGTVTWHQNPPVLNAERKLEYGAIEDVNIQETGLLFFGRPAV